MSLQDLYPAVAAVVVVAAITGPFLIRRALRAVRDRIAPLGWQDGEGWHRGTPDVSRNLRNIHNGSDTK